MITSVHEDKREPFDISERRRAEDALHGLLGRPRRYLRV